ncbi:16 kDa beta-galactoside-binding lectin-like isoform X1 [Zootoca vivipara]|uniref:16 kDa beta-galactoside-binding lectin-like isoform X1 n=1 Tax=Zootoca vivipara TaxID=8524 RepID=UPI00293BC25B|nr:16 kDa beta-galactoside-binding lectin-like isoform X1 [Zootoca vivipara]
MTSPISSPHRGALNRQPSDRQAQEAEWFRPQRHPRPLKQMVFSHLSIKSGECIKVKGKVPPEAKSFALNLGHDDSDMILHFNPRFDCHGDVNTIVCNSKTNGQWDSELRESVFPFQQGEDTKICLSFDEEEVTVKINGDQEVKFPNRLGVNSAKIFSVEGDIAIRSVKFD